MGTSAVLPERRRQKKTFYVNGACDRRRCTRGEYSPQFITSKMADVVDVEDDGDVLARFFKFAGGTSQVHWPPLRCTWDEKSRQPATATQVIAGRSTAYENRGSTCKLCVGSS